MQENFDKLCNDNPGFECKVYDNEDCYNFIKDYFGNSVANAYNKLIPESYKSDLWRYCVLYINGGIYLDIKFGCVNGFTLNSVLDKEYFVLDLYVDSAKTNYVYTGFMVCKPRNQKLLKCISQIVKNVKNNYYGINPLCPTGPGLLNDAFSESEKKEMEFTVTCTPNPLISHPNTNIVFNNYTLISSYNEYRLEQINNMQKPHYGPSWFKKQIYNLDDDKVVTNKLLISDPMKYLNTDSLISNKPTVNKKLLVCGWRNINHSYSLVNQFQLLELVKNKDITLYHKDEPYYVNFWSSSKNNSGLDENSKNVINKITNYNNEDVDTILNISTTYKLSNNKSKNINFIVLEYTLDKTLLKEIKLEDLTKDNNYIVTPSNWSKNKLVLLGLKSDKIHVISHGINTNIFKPLNHDKKDKLREKFNLPKNEYIFLNIGGPFHNKGLDILLNAFGKVLLINSKCKLVLKYNEDLYKLSLTNYINSVVKDERTRNNINNNIIIINKTLTLDELNELYNSVDCYVSSYRAEGFNIPVLEATASGLNIIVTDGGSTDDFTLAEQTTKIKCDMKFLNNNDETTYYLEPQIDDLVMKMLYIKANKKPINLDLLNKHLEKYSWKNIVDQLVKVL